MPITDKLTSFFEKISPGSRVALSVFIIVIIGFFDTITGYELHFFPVYLIPIAFSAWFSGRNAGLAISALSALTWLMSDFQSGNVYSSLWFAYWNSGVRFLVFSLAADLLASLRQSHENLKRLARIDPLTGAANGRYFRELLAAEIYRCQRYKKPFTVAYIDLDNFKTVNDQSGHSVGDEVLIKVATEAKNNLRIIDVTARLGGDEFGLLLPEAGADVAKIVIFKLQKWLQDQMEINDWPVTFSIGAVTYLDNPPSMDEVIRAADNLMYEVKRSGKNSVRFLTV